MGLLSPTMTNFSPANFPPRAARLSTFGQACASNWMSGLRGTKWMQSEVLGAMRWPALAVAVVFAGAISAYFYFHPRSIEVRESQLRKRLIVFRVVFEEYTYDKQKA